MSPVTPLSISYGHAGCLKARAFPRPVFSLSQPPPHGRLLQFMAELPSEPLLGSLCQLALELITSFNSPDGDCCICLGPMHAHAAPLFLLTTCYHCLHTACARAYVGWQHQHPPEVLLVLHCREERDKERFGQREGSAEGLVHRGVRGG